ncbi:hypothetical protein BH20ACT2_BH20ACT2_01290 [soil metagenome]
MTLWWIGNAVLGLVVAPAVIYFANRVVRTAFEIRAYADDVLEHGVGLTGTLDAVPKLVTTRELTGAAGQLVGRYGAALERLQSLPPGESGRRRAPLSARSGNRHYERSGT